MSRPDEAAHLRKDIDAIKDKVLEIQKMVKQLADAKAGKRSVEVKTSFSSQE